MLHILGSVDKPTEGKVMVEGMDISSMNQTQAAISFGVLQAINIFAAGVVGRLPLSVWNQIAGQIGNAEADTYIRVLAEDDITLSELKELEADILQMVGRQYVMVSENRIQEKITNDNMMKGYMLIIGLFCILLAMIGIANVFSNTLGFLTQRKQEFAQYMSVGMRKMFCIEALVIARRPFLITLPITALSIGYMIKASYLNPVEFLTQVPIVPIIIFILAIFGFVSLAYYIGVKKVLKCSLAEALRNDII